MLLYRFQTKWVLHEDFPSSQKLPRKQSLLFSKVCLPRSSERTGTPAVARRPIGDRNKNNAGSSKTNRFLNGSGGGKPDFAQGGGKDPSKIESALEKIVENIAKEDIMKIVDYHKCIEKESIRCKTIVQNLLKFSRKSKVEFGFVDINTVLDEAVTFTEHQLQLCNVKLIKNLDEGVPEIYGNSAQLQQVFTNMIINAKKAMSEGGTLSISSKYINGNGSGVDMVKIEFSDTGCGIAPEHLGKIFDPFFTTRKIGEGTGLGLSISYGIVKEHHGDIKVESEHNKGTVFTICLPAEQKNTSAS